jgi:glycerophosphoryl diester phosphodiesterase
MKRWYIRFRLGLGSLFGLPADVVQMPEYHEGSRILTPRLVRTLARKGIPVHVWTVNEPADMHRLLDWGAEGLLTDRPDLLGEVLHERVGRPLAPGHPERPS